MKLRMGAMVGLLALAASGLAACGDSNGDSEARVRVFHASPDAPNVDVLVDQGRVLEDVSYTAASDFLPVPSGTRHVAVTATGTDTAVIDARLELESDVDYLIVAAGKLASIAPIVTTCDRSQPEGDNARIRVLHSAASAPNVDVYATAPGAGIEDAEPVLSDVPFRAISDYLTVPGGTYDIRVTVSGTKRVAIEALNLNIPAGTVATVAALDATGGGAPFSLEVLSER